MKRILLAAAFVAVGFTGQEVCAQTTLWEGEQVFTNWESISIDKDKFASVEVLDKIVVTVTAVDNAVTQWPQFILKTSDWGTLEGVLTSSAGTYPVCVSNLETTITPSEGDSRTSTMLDELKNGGLNIQAKGLTVTKI